MKTFTLAIIANEPSETVEDQLLPVLAERGINAERIPLRHVQLSSFDTDPALKALLAYDMVYYRTALEPVGAFLLQQWLAKHGKRMINGVYDRHPYILRKKYQTAVAVQAGLLVPTTILDTTDDYEQLVQSLGTPFVAKADISAQGRDVYLVDSPEVFTEIAEKRKGKKILYQAFVQHRCDYRVHTLGSRAVSVYQRVPSSSDFRSNVSLGGSMEEVDADMTKRLFELAEKAAIAFGLDIAGTDFMEHAQTGELYFAEINNNPGWKGELTNGQSVDISDHVVDYFEELFRTGQHLV